MAQGGRIRGTRNPVASCVHTPGRSIHEPERSQDEVAPLHSKRPFLHARIILPHNDSDLNPKRDSLIVIDSIEMFQINGNDEGTRE